MAVRQGATGDGSCHGMDEGFARCPAGQTDTTILGRACFGRDAGRCRGNAVHRARRRYGGRR